MARAGFCSECNANVWVNDDGSCAAGHAASSVSGVHEVADAPAPVPGPTQPPKKRTGLIVAIVVGVVLLLGCLVVGILMAIAVPVFDAASTSAKTRACYSNQRVIEGAVQQWLAENPDATVEEVAGAVDEDNPIVADGWLTEIPHCTLDPTADYELDGEGATVCPLGDPPDGHGHYSD